MAGPAVAVIWAEAPGELSFLAETFGFRGPERTEEGVAYHRPGLHVDMGTWTWNNERGFTTTLTQVGRHGTEQRARLGELYAASGLGTASAVPEGAGTLFVIRKRIAQHAGALQALMSQLDEVDTDALFGRGRQPAPYLTAGNTEPRMRPSVREPKSSRDTHCHTAGRDFA